MTARAARPCVRVLLAGLAFVSGCAKSGSDPRDSAPAHTEAPPPVPATVMAGPMWPDDPVARAVQIELSRNCFGGASGATPTTRPGVAGVGEGEP